MNPVDQVTDCRWVVSAIPNAVNQLDPSCVVALPNIVQPLMPALFVLICQSPYRPNKLMVIDRDDGRADLCERLVDDAVHSSDAHIRRAGLWWDERSDTEKDELLYAALNALGCLYAWSLHRVLSERSRRSGSARAGAHPLAPPAWSVNRTNLEGRTALHVAARFARVQTLAHLIHHGADVNAVDYDQRTALHRVSMDPSEPEHLACAALLLNAGADVNARDVYGRTPLHGAIGTMCAPLAHLLLARGAELDSFDKEGQRPRDFFVSFRPKEVTDAMLGVLAEFDAQRLSDALAPVAQSTRRRL